MCLLLEREGFTDIVLSLKASNVRETVDAYRAIHARVDYPLHVGVTETGDVANGIVKSAAGIGSLLLDGIGDTIRVSLTDDPVREVETGLRILRAVGLRRDDIELVSCPTCGRTRVNVMQMVEQVNSRLPHKKGYLKGRRHGLRGQWTRRSGGRGHWRRVWKRKRCAV